MALSPMMTYYLTVKEQYKDAIVLFRLGDFYEMFFEDAKEASQILDLTLTGRACGLEERAPMCGIPFHSLNNYLPKLIQAGKKVAICEQLNTPEEAKGMVDRDVVRVVTPGTVIEDAILSEKDNNYLACFAAKDSEIAICWIDISTGELNVMNTLFKDAQHIEELALSIHPTEIICNDAVYQLCKNLQSVEMNKLPKFQRYPETSFVLTNATENLKTHFEVKSLESFELEDKPMAIASLGALLSYVKETQKRDLKHISSINFVKNSDYLIIDPTAKRNLELVESIRDGSKKATLLSILDKTKTSMGARNLKKWVEKPVVSSKIINNRLDAVEELISKTAIRSNLIDVLSQIKDIERLVGKISYGNPSPRDFLALSNSLQVVPNLKVLLSKCDSELLNNLNDSILIHNELQELLFNTIDEDCAATIKDGGVIKSGYSSELDEFRNAKNEGAGWLAELEAKEREVTGIKTLKVGFNRVFGYFIEISRGQAANAPVHYVRKQTLTTGERFITEELKIIEEKLLGAEEKALQLENQIFNYVKSFTVKYIPGLLKISQAIAIVDTLISFAEVSIKNNYCKPVINQSIDKLEIVDGRHPVVESLLKGASYVPNNTELDNCTDRMMIITGPNMSGKSTYMRQVALIAIMAHMGCYVPAKSAEIPITDRVFTRIGASDDLAYGQSTFMVEMLEVATILRNATYKSLIILDEIGRGTSTFDGLAIARAVVQEISQNIRCKTLFSTHYHELTELELLLNGVKNYKVLACERDKGIVFLHKIMPGGTNKSFGIEVAKLAGLPLPVIKHAREVQKLLEKISISTQKEQFEDDNNLLSYGKYNTLTEEIKSIDVDSMTPIQAMIKLKELIEMASRE